MRQLLNVQSATDNLAMPINELLFLRIIIARADKHYLLWVQPGTKTTVPHAAGCSDNHPAQVTRICGVMPIDRRLDLVAWARRTGAWIIEDDYDSEYRYDVKPFPPLWTANENDRVIYVGTVSKTLSPTLRIGYAVVPDALRHVFAIAKQLTDRHNSLLEQEALAHLIQSGAYERHVRRQRRSNNNRRETLINALKANFGSRIDIKGTEAGLHIVVWFKDIPSASEQELISRANDLGVGVYSVRPLFNPPVSSERNDCIGLVMGYASLKPEWIIHGIKLLKKAIDGLY